LEPLVSDKELIRAIRTAAVRLHLTDAEVAVLAGVSLPTASALVRDGRLPQLSRCLRGVALLAQRAALAHTRADLGLP
jgi:hypothetical protein